MFANAHIFEMDSSTLSADCNPQSIFQPFAVVSQFGPARFFLRRLVLKTARTKLFKNTRLLGMVTLAVIASPMVLAQDAGWYAGLSVGQTRASQDEASMVNSQLGGGYSLSTLNHDDRDTGYKLFGGYQFSRNFAVEGGYFNLGSFGISGSTVPAATFSGTTKVKGLNLDLVGSFPVTDRFSVLGRIGANYADVADSFSSSAPLADPNPSKRDTNLKVGVGLQYAFTEALSMRAEIERYRISEPTGGKGDIDMVSLGLIYRFGAKTPTPAPRVMQPEPVAAIAPAPVMPPPPPAAPLSKVTFAADSLFGFDQSSVTPSGKQELDKFAADLKTVNYDVITVTGHTDRIGAPAYNQKLSERRAQAVSAYLVETSGVPASKIVARGVDGAEPVTKPGDCVGKKVTKVLIACLQPDRRVEIEVAGTR